MAPPYAEVIGDPVAHSKSPLIHDFWLRKLAIEGEYRATRVSPGELEDYFRRRRTDPDWRGCNVTMPLKERVLDYVDDLDEVADQAAASNCILSLAEGLIATNTDCHALLFAPGIMAFRKQPIVIVGSGGAARAVIATVAGLGHSDIRLFARNFLAGHQIAKVNGVGGLFAPLEALASLETAGLLINATPLGMAGYEPFPAAALERVTSFQSDAIIFDMVYNPIETELLATARRAGLKTISGLEMLKAQARRSFELFFGKRPSSEYDEELQELLTS